MKALSDWVDVVCLIVSCGDFDHAIIKLWATKI